MNLICEYCGTRCPTVSETLDYDGETAVICDECHREMEDDD